MHSYKWTLIIKKTEKNINIRCKIAKECMHASSCVRLKRCTSVKGHYSIYITVHAQNNHCNAIIIYIFYNLIKFFRGSYNGNFLSLFFEQFIAAGSLASRAPSHAALSFVTVHWSAATVRGRGGACGGGGPCDVADLEVLLAVVVLAVLSLLAGTMTPVKDTDEEEYKDKNGHHYAEDDVQETMITIRSSYIGIYIYIYIYIDTYLLLISSFLSKKINL